MKIDIIKSVRKTLSLSINNEATLIIKAPNTMNNDVIATYVNKKQKWIKTKINYVETLNNKFADYINYNKILIMGVAHNIMHYNIEHVTVHQNNIMIPNKFNKNKKLFLINIKKYLIYNANIFLQQRIILLQKKLNISVTYQICSFRAKWGSCSNTFNIKLNWRMYLLHTELIDYIIIHELCHTIHFNHSKAFWSLLRYYLPNFKTIIKKLKEYQFVIDLF